MAKKSRYNITVDPEVWNRLMNLMSDDNFSMSSFLEDSIMARIALIEGKIDIIKLEKKIKEREGQIEKEQRELINYRTMLESMKKENERKRTKEEEARVSRAKRTIEGLKAAGIH